MTESPTLRLLRLSFVRGIGNVALKTLANRPEFGSTPDQDLDELLSQKASRARRFTNETLEQAERRWQEQLQAMERDSSRVISILNEDYPPLLRATRDGPALLFVKGGLQNERTVSVIGTREPTEHGHETARRMTQHFASRGWRIVSGLALGIDSVAHQAALASDGHTVAVLAHGLHTIAPRQNARLAEAILDAGGALVTEYPHGQAPGVGTFVARDRIQAGLSQGVIMVQSDLKGGSRHASRASLKYGRPVAVPQPTSRDITTMAPKIAANLAIIHRTPEGQAFLETQDWARVHLLKSREDYTVVEEALLATSAQWTSTVQTRLL